LLPPTTATTLTPRGSSYSSSLCLCSPHPTPSSCFLHLSHCLPMSPRTQIEVEIPAPYSAYLPSTVLSVFPEKTRSQDATSKTFLTGVRSIVRHNAHFLQDVTNGGDFSKDSEVGIKKEEFSRATWNDLLDMVSYRDGLDSSLTSHQQASVLDRMDGGFTLIVHCSGWSSTQDILPLDVYIPSKEIRRHHKEIEPPILQVVQVFARYIAVPHICHLSLHRGTVSTFAKGCSLLASGSIPPAVETGSPHFRFHVQSGDNSEHSPDDSFDWSPDSEACKVHDSASAATSETGMSTPTIFYNIYTYASTLPPPKYSSFYCHQPQFSPHPTVLGAKQPLRVPYLSSPCCHLQLFVQHCQPTQPSVVGSAVQ